MKAITNSEVTYFSQKLGIPEEDVVSFIEKMCKEAELTQSGIERTIRENGYVCFPSDLRVFGYGAEGELNRKYISYTPNVPQILEHPKDEIAIVSGFGATNTPTLGTLSMILKLIEFQRKTGLYTYLIINDLGSINARNIDAEYVLNLTDHFIDFIKKMGFDLECGEIRTHNNLDHARVFSLISRVIKLSDFMTNTEATDSTYEILKLRGNDFSAMVDHVYTATDVLLPIIKDQKKCILVPCGLEEFYHANIGGIAMGRLCQMKDMESLLPESIQVGCIHSKLVPGFFPFFKQSKSIHASSINLGDSADEIIDKVMNNHPRDEEIILSMIQLGTNWTAKEVTEVEKAFNNRLVDEKTWLFYKKKFADWFISVKQLWDSYDERTAFKPLREKLFKEGD